jgi:hypothetical protein
MTEGPRGRPFHIRSCGAPAGRGGPLRPAHRSQGANRSPAASNLCAIAIIRDSQASL